MNNSNKASNAPAGEYETPRRRLADEIVRKDAGKMNLDRRIKGSERRQRNDPKYRGPSRRHTIDRRLNLKDRREAC